MTNFPREQIHPRIASLAASNVFIGTSSWKYPGWCGQLYDEQNYLTRGKFSKKRFEENSLAVPRPME